jgi:hypothetical protein
MTPSPELKSNIHKHFAKIIMSFATSVAHSSRIVPPVKQRKLQVLPSNMKFFKELKTTGKHC